MGLQMSQPSMRRLEAHEVSALRDQLMLSLILEGLHVQSKKKIL